MHDRTILYDYPFFIHKIKKLQFVTSMASSSSTKVVAEYAKSDRSSCNKCSKTIAKTTLRLGSESKVPGGFYVTKWHHLKCFPLNFLHPIDSLHAVQGFSSLKCSDQEALKKLVTEGDKSSKKVSDEDENSGEGSTEKISKIHKREEGKKNELEERKSKKEKVSDEDENSGEGSTEKINKLSTPNEASELEIAFSISDVMDKYKDASLTPKWKAYRTIIFLEWDDGLRDSEKIAAFDFDGCLAKTSVKRTGADAWSLMYVSIPEKLQSLYNDGYKLVIFTNESNIDRWKNKRQVAVDSKIGRLNNFIKNVKVPIQVFIACGVNKSGQAEDPFRKPKPGMWCIMQQHFNSGIVIDMNQSFYVGDAAGRKGDHSDADIKFAQLIGLKFYVPEEYFSSA